MEGERFDNFTKTLARASRRSFLRAALGAILGGALGAAGLGIAEAAAKRSVGSTCRRDADCASGVCGPKDRTGRHRCACPAGTVAVNGACADPATAFLSDPANCGAPGTVCPRTRCQRAVCTGGVCGLTPDPTMVGRSCNDGNACTQNDVCRDDGSCAGTPVTCATSDQCHAAGTCDPATGQCSTPAKANGSPCNDGDACTQTDTCQNGGCVGGNPKTCTASDQCHTAGTCDPQTGQCSNPKKADGSACDDGNLCTQNDICQGGTCVAGPPKTCSASDQCHDAGTCNPSTGQCSNPRKADGTSCVADSDACTADTCQAGVCTAGAPKDCSTDPAFNDQCNVGVCNPSTGQCEQHPKQNGTTCDDGDACTQTDTCQDGTCVGGNPVTCAASDPCHAAGTCDPATGQCSDPAKPNGTACSDNNACTQTDTCQDGVCTPETNVTCAAAGPCQNPGVCNPASGTCEYTNKTDGIACDDGDKCTVDDTCQNGVCTAGTPKVCTASDQCHTAGTCDPQTGQCPNPPKTNGAPCDDGNACTQTDTCRDGVCVGGNPKTCVASDQCHTVGVCDPATGQCSNPEKPLAAACDDGDKCTFNDTCQFGVCVSGVPELCTASDQCHDAGVCDSATGICSNPAKADGTSCVADNDACSAGTCQNGVCALSGNPVACPPGDICVADSGCQCTFPGSFVCGGRPFGVCGCTTTVAGSLICADLRSPASCAQFTPCTSDTDCPSGTVCANDPIPPQFFGCGKVCFGACTPAGGT